MNTLIATSAVVFFLLFAYFFDQHLSIWQTLVLWALWKIMLELGDLKRR